MNAANHDRLTSRPIQNVYCIGRNYKLHAEELGNAVPKEPMVFMKPTHAVTHIGEAKTLPLPLERGSIHHELEIVVRIGKKVEPGMTADQVIDAFALGIDFTLRDVQDVLKQKGHPWLPAKGRLHTGPITSFVPFPGCNTINETPFSLFVNDRLVQQGALKDMIFNLDTLIQYVALHYGLDEGDIIFTGTPAGVGPVQAGDCLRLKWDDQLVGKCFIAALSGNVKES